MMTCPILEGKSMSFKPLKKHLKSNRWFVDTLAKASIRLSPWFRSGVFFLHQGRCGSTVVADLLGQHPKISFYGEIFKRYHSLKDLPASPENLLRVRQLTAFPNHALVAAKFMECQHPSTLGLSLNEFVRLIKHCGFRKFIVLNRRHYLKKLVSARVAVERGGKWHYKRNEVMPPKTIQLDADNVTIGEMKAPIIDLFKYIDEQYQKLRNALAEEDVIELTYEEDIYADPLIAYNKICHWLGIERTPVNVKFKKTNKADLNKVVENWGEVAGSLKGTKYAWMSELDL